MVAIIPEQTIFSLEDFMADPPEQMEWVDGQLVEKTGMTLKHSEIQAKLARYWGNFLALLNSSMNLGGNWNIPKAEVVE